MYKELSQEAHLTLAGIVRASAALDKHSSLSEERRRELLAKQVSDSFAVTVILAVCIVSEVQVAFSYGLGGSASRAVGTDCPRLHTRSGDVRKALCAAVGPGSDTIARDRDAVMPS